MVTRAGALIVGAGQAAVEVASALRQDGFSSSIVMVGAERELPYQRPPLSKQYLTDDMGVQGLLLRSVGFYAQQAIEVMTGTRVSQIALESASTGGVATTETGQEIAFEHLVFATGARPRRIQVPGAELEGVMYLRDLASATALRRALREAHSVAIVGGGFIGLETAAVAAQLGKQTHVIEAASRLLGRIVAPIVSDFYRAAHLRRGVEVRLSAQVARFGGCGGRVELVELQDRSHIAADLVLVGIGAIPRTELASAAGIRCENGIVVDAFARTDRQGVVAAGDCTIQPRPGQPGGGAIRLESVQNAVDQGRVAAATILGAEPNQTTVPRFWSNQGDLRLQTVGISAGWDQLVVRGSTQAERFSVLYFRDRELIAADAINSSADFTACRIALGRGASITPEAAETVPELRALVA